MRSVCLKNLTLRGYGAMAEPPARMRASIGTALDYLATGQMSIRIGRVLPLAEANLALAALARREITGKVLLDTRGETVRTGDIDDQRA